jgi:hypothetical protein
MNYNELTALQLTQVEYGTLHDIVSLQAYRNACEAKRNEMREFKHGQDSMQNWLGKVTTLATIITWCDRKIAQLSSQVEVAA